jgi:tRNA splicing endonuclease
MEAEASAQASTNPPDIGGLISVTRVTRRPEHAPEDGLATHMYLIWDAKDAIRLRGQGKLAVSAVGMCPLKLHTKGKAAAVPVILSHEELYTAYTNKWIQVTDSVTGTDVDVGPDLAAAVAGDPRLALKRAVFIVLWRNGYRTTNGIKFGVDYLAYTADPSVVHAPFMIIVDEEGGLIAPLDLVGRARVATTALKTCVMAYANPATGAVRYEAFRRIGPGGAVFESASTMLPAVIEAEREARAARTRPPPSTAAAAQPDEPQADPVVEYVDPAALFGPRT